jgi:tRNA(Ile)-lysidine synthase
VYPAGDLRISRSFGTVVLEIVARGESQSAVSLPESVELAKESGLGLARIGDRAIQVSWDSGPGDASPPASSGSAASDRVALAVEAEHFPLRLRKWTPGDRIHTRGGTRKLKKLFAEHRLSREDRMRRPVLVDRSGRVIWVSGVAVAEWARSEPENAGLLIEIENA